MDEDGKKILKAVQQMRRIFKDISKLLLTVDDLMMKERWLKTGGAVYANSSAAIEKPEQWMPSEIFRFYKNKDSPHYLAFVSILLDDDIEEHKYTIEEPLITAGFFDYGEGIVTDNGNYWYARLYGYMEDSENNGKPITTTEKEWLTWGEEYPFKSATCFGLPLTSITNPLDIETKIVSPLIKMLTR